MMTFPTIRVADPISHESISIFPLEAEAESKVDYVLGGSLLTPSLASSPRRTE